MKKTILACTCALLLSSGSVFAQMQPAPGGAAHGDVGPGVNKGKTAKSVKAKSVKTEKGMTTGTGKMKAGSQSSANPSSSGNVGPGTNNNAGPQPGGR